MLGVIDSRTIAVLFRPRIVMTFGIVILLGQILIVCDILLTRFTGTLTTGEVVEVFQPRFDNAYRIRFRTGDESVAQFSTTRFGPAYRVGEQVTIAYLPGREAQAIVVRPLIPDDLYLAIAVPLIVWFGLWCIRSGWRRSVAAAQV